MGGDRHTAHKERGWFVEYRGRAATVMMASVQCYRDSFFFFFLELETVQMIRFAFLIFESE